MFSANYHAQLPRAKRAIKNLGLCTLHTFYRILRFKIATKLIFMLIMFYRRSIYRAGELFEIKKG